MKITDIHIYQYSLDLEQPLNVRGQKLKNREGLVLHLRAEGGIDGFGEIAPLPGFSPESLTEARDQIQSLKSKLRGQTIPENIEKFNGKFDHWLNPFALKPSVRFGIEAAVLHLLSNARNIPLYKLIPGTTHHLIRVAGLLSGSKSQIKVQAEELIAQGFKELKLKIGGDVQEATAKIQAVNDVAYGKALLHVDVNQMWDFDQAVAFGKAIGCAAVNYIEEPFKDIEQIPKFFDQTLIPVALDESVQHVPLEDIKSISGVETLILKPTILGGIEKTLSIMTQAENYALDTAISSSFESSLGIWTLANITEASTHHIAAGLDTLKWFKTDLLKQKMSIQHGVIDIKEQTIQAKDINFDLLSELS